MNLTPVKSSTIVAVGHDAPTKTLGVQFKSGGVYHYHGVEAAHHDALIKAESVGKHFAAHIKPHFKFTKQEKAA